MAEALAGQWWVFVLVGICAGLLSGALGIGSGSVIVPALVLLFGASQKSAQGTALTLMVPMALVAAIRYKMNPEVEIDTMRLAVLALGAIPAALLGAQLAQLLPGSLLRKLFAIFLIVVSIRMLWPERVPQTAPASDNKAAAQSARRSGP